MIWVIANLGVLVAMPIVLVGVINRVKSLWSGRRGPPILQLAFDLVRLVRKTSVYSVTTTPMIRITPYVLLATSLGAALVVPLLGEDPVASFPFDFVWFAYAWGLGRVATMLGALDTGSSFEGMGAARDATFSTILEPTLFLVVGSLCLLSDTRTLAVAVSPALQTPPAFVIWVASIVALMIVLQVEAARMPIDDPATHLELTMVHEVMVLDHGGPELAAIQLASAVKLLVGASLVATLVNPLAGTGSIGAIANVGLTLAIAAAIGTVESLIARLALRAVPQYIAVALAAGAVALLATASRALGAP